MKTIKQLLITIVALLCSATASAYDFEVDGIYYNILSEEEKTVEVTSGENNYTGAVTIPESIIYNNTNYNVTSIEEGAFYDCYSLISIEIPGSITSIGKSAFYYCEGLTSIEIPDNVTNIGDETFAFCKSLTSVTIPNSVTAIGQSTFYGCSSLTSITIPNSVTTIGSNAFSYCSALTSVTIPNSVTDIGDSAFAWTNLRIITIPNSVTDIGDSAFAWCTYLISVTIPNSVTTIGQNAFYSCDGLTEVHINDIAAWCNIDFEDARANPLNNAKNLYLDGNKITDVIIPNSVTSIGDYAFIEYTDLKNVTIPKSVTTIGGSAFAGCTNLRSVTIPNSVTTIGQNAFYGCNRITSITIPNSVTSIGRCAFSNCSGITKATIGNGVTSIEEGVFFGCERITSITIPNSVTSIGEEAFRSTGLTSVTIPNSVISIGMGSFLGCKDLTSVIISNSVTSIGDWAFSECSSLTSITSLIPVDNLFVPGIDAFYGVDKANSTLYVPYGAKETYAAIEGWNEFTNIVEIRNTYTASFTIDGEIIATKNILEGDTIVYPNVPEKEGYTFSGWSEAPAIMPAEDVVIEGSFTLNSYAVTYLVDGEEFAVDSVAYGSEVILRDEPTKEGHTFSGWSEVPETMPAKDIVVEGSFSVNSYLLTYKIDGETYATDSITYGATITPIAEPTKEGHTFSGWSEIPETMPAKDIIVEGSFSVNSYTVTFMIDGDVYETATVEFGAEIELPTPTEKPGYIFSGWLDVPTTMPAKDIVIEGKFEIDTTGINTVTLDLEKNEVYNLKGQRITESKNLTRGIYIVNGKKTLVK